MVNFQIKFRFQQEKNPSQQFIEYLYKRTQVIDFINSNFKENHFGNNVTILKIKNANVKFENLIKIQDEKENGLSHNSCKSFKNQINVNDSISPEAFNHSKLYLNK